MWLGKEAKNGFTRITFCHQSANRLCVVSSTLSRETLRHHWSGSWGGLVPTPSSQLMSRQWALMSSFIAWWVWGLCLFCSPLRLLYILGCSWCLNSASAYLLHWWVGWKHGSFVPPSQPLLLTQGSQALATCVWIQMLHGSGACPFHLYLGMF